MDTSNFTNITSLQGMASVVNSSTDGLLFIGAMFVFWIIIMMVLISRSQLPFENNFTVSSWIMFLASSFFWAAHLLPTVVPLIFLVLSAFGTLYLFSSSR